MRALIGLLGAIAGLVVATLAYMLPTIIAGPGHGLGGGVLGLLWLLGVIVGPIVAVRRWDLRQRKLPS